MFFAIKKRTGEVAMISEKEMELNDKFDVVEYQPTSNEAQKIKENWRMVYRDGQFQFIENAMGKKEKKANVLEEVKQAVKDKNSDPRELLAKLLDVIEV